MIDVEAILHSGQKKLDDEHKANEKSGVLHSGNTGIVTPDGDVLGECVRLALGRYLGFEPPKNEFAEHFFNGGFANEWVIMRLLNAGYTDDIKSEKEIPTAWVVNEKHVGGKPDAVLFDNGKPVMGLELKGIQSAYRANLIHGKCLPSSSHFCQAAHYSWQLKIPFDLLYSSYSSYYKIKPGRKHFYCDWDDKNFFYINPDTKKRVRTVITAEGIQTFYKLILLQEEAKELGPEYDPSPVTEELEADYNKCKSCGFKEACERFKNYDDWVSAAKVISDGGSI